MALDSEPVRARGIIVIYTGYDVLLSSPACPAEKKKRESREQSCQLKGDG